MAFVQIGFREIALIGGCNIIDTHTGTLRVVNGESARRPPDRVIGINPENRYTKGLRGEISFGARDALLMGWTRFGAIRRQEPDMAGKSKQDTANAQFRKVQRDEDAKRAMSDYEAEAAAVAAKTARLRAERLARDAALPPKEPAAPKQKKTSGAKKKGPAPSLSEWLDVQGKEGRRR